MGDGRGKRETDLMKITRFEELDCWVEARKPVKMVYDVIRKDKSFQNDYRLRDQSIGAAISTMENISEGFARRSNKEFIQFLFIAVSSAAELQSHMYVARDQNYVSQQLFEDIYDQADRTSRLISGLITYLRNNERNYKRNKQNKP
jgi:four helix bundle protein